MMTVSRQLTFFDLLHSLVKVASSDSHRKFISEIVDPPQILRICQRSPNGG